MTQELTRRLFSLSAIVSLSALLVAPASAVTINTVPVGNAGNVNDTTGFGAVSYDYLVATTEVTNSQYAEFLNAKAASDPLDLYNPFMGSDARGGITRSGASGSFTYAAKTDMGNKPVNLVNWYDSIRFANWLHNGQGLGDTETGAYTLDGGTPTPSNGLTITRNVGAMWFLTSEDEWYKAAYHQPAAQGGDSDDYWLYPTASNSAPTIATANSVGDISNPGANVANYNLGADWNSLNGNVTTVGSAGALSNSYYGTADQGGNVLEWNEALISGSFRGLRGGSYSVNSFGLRSSIRDSLSPTSGNNYSLGFRVATVPEPSTLVLAGLGGVGLLLRSRRRRVTRQNIVGLAATSQLARRSCWRWLAARKRRPCQKKERLMKRVSPSLLCGLWLLCNVARLNAGSIYYTDGNNHHVNRANTDGSGATSIVSQGFPAYLDLDLSNNKIYWSDIISSNSIYQGNLDGTGVTRILTGLATSGSGGVTGVVAHPAANKLFWGTFSNSGTGTIGVANLDGTNSSTLVSLASQVRDLAVNPISGKLYWTSPTHISSMNLDGTGQTVVANFPPSTSAHNLAVDSAQAKIYWTTGSGASQGSIQSANLDGSGVATLLTNLGNPYGIAIDSVNGKMFWTNVNDSTVHRANLDGSNASTIVSGLNFPQDITFAPIVPEPSTAVLAIVGCGLMWVLRRQLK
jgi:formylglycine-generating enzyme required for sulfatase activity